MESTLAKLLGLKSQPVAVVQTDTRPEECIELPKGKWGCAVAFLKAASQGKTALFYQENTACMGARAGLSFALYPLGWIEYFLSCGSETVGEGEFYKKTPELARSFVTQLTLLPPKKYLVFYPLHQLPEEETPAVIVFLVNADQLSALAVLANYDQETQDNVKLLFGAGCAQAVLYPLVEEAQGGLHCFVGLTDLSARKCIPGDLLSFAIPYHRFLTLEQEAEGSFLTKRTWQGLLARRG